MRRKKMLSLSNVSVEMAGSYFEKDDYYSSDGSPGKPEFFGNAAKELGLKTEFDHEIFEKLLRGYALDGSPLIELKSRALSDKELFQAERSFLKKTEKIGINESYVSFIKMNVIDKAKENKRHFSQEERNHLAAEVNKFVSAISVDSEAKTGLKKTSMQLLKNLSKASHRAGLDCTFSAPKSVSIACLVGGKNELLDAHKTAVNEAIKFIESRLSGTRMGSKKSRQFVRTGNVVGAKFHHGTSREGDPQLHTHCVIMNLTEREKNKWRTMHTDSIYQHSKLAGILYQNKLAELVQKLGYQIDVKTNGTFELKGYTEAQLSTFSKRRHQVLETSAKAIFDDMKRNHLLKEGQSFEEIKGELVSQVNQKMNRSSVMKERKIKTEIKAEKLKEKWLEEAKQNSIKHPERERRSNLFGTKLDLDFSKDHLTERSSVIKKLELLIHNLSKNLGRATSHEIAKASSNDLDLVTSYRQKDSLASFNHAQKEVQIAKLATSGKGIFRSFNEISSQILEPSLGLTNDQKNAFSLTVSSKDQTIIWNGVAGSGKTWALKEIKEVAQIRGYRIIATAPDASSASILGNQLGITSSTVHSFLKSANDIKKTILIVDEASKFSTKLMHDLLKKIEGSNCRLILSGDHRQLGSVEAGNPYKALLKSNITIASFDESVRQKTDKMKEIVSAVSTQKPQSIRWALKELGDKIAERKSLSARINVIVNAYDKLEPIERKNTLIIADTNHERSLLTDQLREKKKALGELSSKEENLKILIPKDLTEAQKRNAEYFQKGDILLTHTKSATLSLDKHYEILGIEKGRILATDGIKTVLIQPSKVNLSVYQLKSIKVAAGEKLEWRRNHDCHKNREEVTVKNLSSKEAVLVKKSGEKIRIDLKKPQFIDYAHVSTTYSSQGKTADRVLALMQSTTSKESFYVAISRARNDVQIVTDNKSKLVERALKSSAKENALDHVDSKFSFTPAPGQSLYLER